jgi:hypothetical protein
MANPFSQSSNGAKLRPESEAVIEALVTTLRRVGSEQMRNESRVDDDRFRLMLPMARGNHATERPSRLSAKPSLF